ncbi:hypothetical protein B7486_40875 [cyanobacterium TDX16]|nr:hypothetical protein B7486_40875 [cyanobacterium TDX16]
MPKMLLNLRFSCQKAVNYIKILSYFAMDWLVIGHWSLVIGHLYFHAPLPTEFKPQDSVCQRAIAFKLGRVNVGSSYE